MCVGWVEPKKLNANFPGFKSSFEARHKQETNFLHLRSKPVLNEKKKEVRKKISRSLTSFHGVESNKRIFLF